MPQLPSPVHKPTSSLQWGHMKVWNFVAFKKMICVSRITALNFSRGSTNIFLACFLSGPGRSLYVQEKKYVPAAHCMTLRIMSQDTSKLRCPKYVKSDFLHHQAIRKPFSPCKSLGCVLHGDGADSCSNSVRILKLSERDFVLLASRVYLKVKTWRDGLKVCDRCRRKHLKKNWNPQSNKSECYFCFHQGLTSTGRKRPIRPSNTHLTRLGGDVHSHSTHITRNSHTKLSHSTHSLTSHTHTHTHTGPIGGKTCSKHNEAALKAFNDDDDNSFIDNPSSSPPPLKKNKKCLPQRRTKDDLLNNVHII